MMEYRSGRIGSRAYLEAVRDVVGNNSLNAVSNKYQAAWTAEDDEWLAKGMHRPPSQEYQRSGRGRGRGRGQTRGMSYNRRSRGQNGRPPTPPSHPSPRSKPTQESQERQMWGDEEQWDQETPENHPEVQSEEEETSYDEDGFPILHPPPPLNQHTMGQRGSE